MRLDSQLPGDIITVVPDRTNVLKECTTSSQLLCPAHRQHASFECLRLEGTTNLGIQVRVQKIVIWIECAEGVLAEQGIGCWSIAWVAVSC